MTRSTLDPKPVGIDGIDLTASRKGLRVTLTIPAVQGGLKPEEVAYWQDQVFLFDQSRVMLRDIKDLTRVLRALPDEALTEEARALKERMTPLDTEVKP
ncbi:hypothetical protein [Deinococcus soli (ex Cha et al. 2016)]|uniref:Uncharacterized protein n=1 Tax=Deinococcus soli (ex Cha et al. 2016) TaxID=1309411 RepID=A0ACC6KLI0_9DEIO|nr:hypothetical protein [Deinococcus soli (ex Cha et al. 2016)]MDR6753457.1 hypothetical protein [Deinococcus soli (ex Cha et al. 2016)]